MSSTGQQRRGGSLGFVVGLALGIPATIFALSNLESVQVEFLGWTASTPLWVVIILSLLAGALIGCALLLAWQARRRHTRKKAARKQARDTTKEPPTGPDTPGPDTPGPNTTGSTEPSETSEREQPDPPGRETSPGAGRAGGSA